MDTPNTVNNLCPACGQYYSGNTHDCPAAQAASSAVVKDPAHAHPLFDTAPLSEKLDAKVEEMKPQADAFIKEALDPITALVQNAQAALSYQIGGSHYSDKPIQPVKFIHLNGLGFVEGSIVKYISRWREKGGVDDLKKVIQYTLQLIALEEKKAKA